MTDQNVERRTLRRNLRDLPTPAWWLIGGVFVNGLGAFVPLFLVLFLPSQRGFTLAEAGVAVALYGLGDVLAGAVGGFLADRIGRRTTMVLSMSASAATTMVLFIAQGRGLILAMALLSGIASESYRPAAAALLADLVPAGQRVTAYAMLRLALNLGFAMGSGIAGFLASRSFLDLFLANAVAALVLALISTTLLPAGAPSRAPVRGHGDPAAAEGFRHAFRDRALVAFLVAWALIAFVYWQQQTALPRQVLSDGLHMWNYGLLLSFNGFLIVFCELPISSWTMHRPPRTMNALSFFLVGAGFALTAVAHSMVGLLATVAVWTTGEMVGAPVGAAYVADLAPEHLRGRYQGLYQLFGGSGTVLGPTLGILLFVHTQVGLWTLCGALGIAAAALVLVTRPRTAAVSSAPAPELLAEAE